MISSAKTASNAMAADRLVNPTNKAIWVDIAKGICVLQVVWFHAATLRLSNPPWTLPEPYAFARLFTHSYNMACFFFLAGLFAFKLLNKRPVDFAATVARGIVYPYFLWSILQVLCLSRFGLQPAQRAEIALVFSKLLTRPYNQFWFLFDLFIFVCVYYLIGRWRAGKVALLLIGLSLLLFPFDAGAAALKMAQEFFLFYTLGAVIGPALLRSGFRVSLIVAIGLFGVLLTVELLCPPGTSSAMGIAFSVVGATATILLARAIELAGGGHWLRRSAGVPSKFTSLTKWACGSRITCSGKG